MSLEASTALSSAAALRTRTCECAALFLASTAANAADDGDAPPKPPPIIDLGSFFSPGMVMQCGNIKIFKTPDGEMQMTGVNKSGKFPIEVKGDQIFLDGKPCVLYSKCEQSVSC